MRFLFVDRVLELHRGNRVLAVRGVASNEDFFAYHFPSRPVMPGSLLIESFAQAGTILLETSAGFTRKALPAFINNVKFRAAVRPGTEMRIQLAIESSADEGAVLRGDIRQGDQVCATGTFGFITAPMGQFYEREFVGVLRNLYQVWLDGAVLEGFARHPLEELPV